MHRDIVMNKFGPLSSTVGKLQCCSIQGHCRQLCGRSNYQHQWVVILVQPRASKCFTLYCGPILYTPKTTHTQITTLCTTYYFLLCFILFRALKAPLKAPLKARLSACQWVSSTRWRDPPIVIFSGWKACSSEINSHFLTALVYGGKEDRKQKRSL